jgi:hypothetical protein
VFCTFITQFSASLSHWVLTITEFEAGSLCRDISIWWNSVIAPQAGSGSYK